MCTDAHRVHPIEFICFFLNMSRMCLHIGLSGKFVPTNLYNLINVLGVQKSSELFFVKFNLYSKTNEKIWLAA